MSEVPFQGSAFEPPANVDRDTPKWMPRYRGGRSPTQEASAAVGGDLGHSPTQTQFTKGPQPRLCSV